MFQGEQLFSEWPDHGRNTIPGYNPPLYYEPGQPPKPSYITPAHARVRMFPHGERTRSLSTASSVASYEGSEPDPDYVDIRDEVDTEEFKRDREEVAMWLTCSDPLPWHSPRMADTMEAPFTLPHVAGSLLSQLFYALLLYLIPFKTRYYMPTPSRFQRPPDPKDAYTYLEDEDNSLKYVINRPGKPDFHIMVTRDWSYDFMKYQPKNSLRIYRVMDYDYLDFIGSVQTQHLFWAIDIRRPVDEFDCVSLVRHGQPSMDIGSGSEQWHMVSANPSCIVEATRWIRQHKIPFSQRLVRLLRRLWPWRRDKRTWVKKNRFNHLLSGYGM